MIENFENPIGDVILSDANEQHRETLDKLDAGTKAIVAALTAQGAQIVRIDAGQTVSQHIRYRVQYIVISRATAGDAILGIGTATYPFTVAAAPVRVDFPLVIERGTDMAYTGDGRIYLVGFPE